MRCFVGLLLVGCSLLVAATAARAAGEGDYIKVEVKGTVAAHSGSFGPSPGRAYLMVKREQYEMDLFPDQSRKDDKERERMRKEAMGYDGKTVIIKGTLRMERNPVRPLILVEKITVVPESEKDPKK